jgi:Spindle pole body component BBP1, C-terminal
MPQPNNRNRADLFRGLIEVLKEYRNYGNQYHHLFLQTRARLSPEELQLCKKVFNTLIQLYRKLSEVPEIVLDRNDVRLNEITIQISALTDQVVDEGDEAMNVMLPKLSG